MTMDNGRPEIEASPPGAGRFSWGQAAVWLAVVPLLGLLAAKVAVTTQFYFAPLGIFPLLVGAGLGGMLVALLRVAQVGHRQTLWAGAVLAGGMAVFGQHYLDYLGEREARLHRQENAGDAIGKLRGAFPGLLESHRIDPPESFVAYMREQADQGRPLTSQWTVRGTAAWITWAVEAALTLVATMAVMLPALRQPYCNRCRSWYRTVRSGRVPAAGAQRLAEAAGVCLEMPVKSGRYRLSNCSSGCGPARIELSWETLAGDTFLSTVWLDVDRRGHVGRALDELSQQA